MNELLAKRNPSCPGLFFSLVLAYCPLCESLALRVDGLELPWFLLCLSEQTRGVLLDLMFPMWNQTAVTVIQPQETVVKPSQDNMFNYV